MTHITETAHQAGGAQGCLGGSTRPIGHSATLGADGSSIRGAAVPCEVRSCSPMGLDQLSALLAHERRLLGLLLLELERERESLAHDGTPGLGEATRAVEAVVDRLRTVELVRAVAAHDVASSVGLDGDSDLSTIARAVAPPWDAVLEEHRTALTTLAARVAAEGEDARDLLVTAARAVEQQLAGATGGIGAAPR